MNNPKQFYKSVDILINAHNSGRLVNLNCSACAVGNLIRESCGYKNPDNQIGLYWSDPKCGGARVYTLDWYDHIRVSDDFIPPHVKKQFDATGYSRKQLDEIEKAFEHPESTRYNYLNGTSRGLLEVVHKLADIHNASTDELTEALTCVERTTKIKR